MMGEHIAQSRRSTSAIDEDEMDGSAARVTHLSRGEGRNSLPLYLVLQFVCYWALSSTAMKGGSRKWSDVKVMAVSNSNTP